MKTAAAIKKIEARAKLVGKKVNISHYEGRHKACFYFEGSDRLVEFHTRNGDEDSVGCIRVRRFNDHDDSMTDYFVGFFVDNIKQALDSVAPAPPKYEVGSLVRFKDSKYNQRRGLAGVLALVSKASNGGNYRVMPCGDHSDRVARQLSGWQKENQLALA